VAADLDRKKLEQSGSKYARYLCKILGLYYDYHMDAYSTKGKMSVGLIYILEDEKLNN
jgi:hypothetical protein